MNSNILTPMTKLKVMTQKVSIKSIQNGATSSRDWAPLHTDQKWAVNEGNLPNIIMNNYTLNGLIIKYATNIYGPSSRVGKVKFKIKRPICPDSLLEFHGIIAEKQKIDNSRSLLKIDLEIKVGSVKSTSAVIYIAINDGSNLDASAWKMNSSEWLACLKLCQK